MTRAHRVLAVVVGLVVIIAVAACGRDDAAVDVDPPPRESSPGLEAGPTTSTEAALGATPTTLGSDGAPPSPPPGDGGGPGPGPGGPGPGGPAPPPGSPAPPPLNPNVSPGLFAPAYLRRDLSSSVVVEIAFQADAAPEDATVNGVVNTLRSVTGKEVATTRTQIGGGARDWTAADLRSSADGAAQRPQGNGAAVVRLVFVHGTFGGNRSVLGAVVRGDVAALFVDQIRRSGSPLVPVRTIEHAAAVHEVGHLLGLVDLCGDTNRDDPEHPGHSTNPESVMYWAVETDLVAQVLNGPPSTEFDAADRADLAAIRDGRGCGS